MAPFPFGLTDRDFGLVALGNVDLEAQVHAVKVVLTRNRAAEIAHAKSIKLSEQSIREAQTKPSGLHDGHPAYDDHIADLQASVFFDAAHSMSAVGMLAPLFESLFVAAFDGLRKVVFRNRWQPEANDPRAELVGDEYWNPHLVARGASSQSDLAAGIAQLAQSIGLHSLLPAGYERQLKALLVYRNKMFHWGFEWPMNQRTKFVRTIADQGWPEAWFSCSTTDHKPWIFYMTESFIEELLALIDGVLKGVGRLTEGE